MIYKEYPIRVEGSTDRAKLTTYLISHSEEIGINERPMIIICPGGGYCFVSDREAEMFALHCNAMLLVIMQQCCVIPWNRQFIRRLLLNLQQL